MGEIIEAIFNVMVCICTLGIITYAIVYSMQTFRRYMYIKAVIRTEDKEYVNAYINELDYKNTDEIILRAISIDNRVEEFKIAMEYVLVVDKSEKKMYRDHWYN